MKEKRVLELTGEEFAALVSKATGGKVVAIRGYVDTGRGHPLDRDVVPADFVGQGRVTVEIDEGGPLSFDEIIDSLREEIDERVLELAERMRSPGQFPGISASEGHELSAAVIVAYRILSRHPRKS